MLCSWAQRCFGHKTLHHKLPLDGAVTLLGKNKTILWTPSFQSKNKKQVDSLKASSGLKGTSRGSFAWMWHFLKPKIGHQIYYCIEKASEQGENNAEAPVHAPQ